MTLPKTSILPLRTDQIREGGESLEKYMRELIFSLQRQYEDIAQAVNGDFRRDIDSLQFQWTPTVKDSLADTTTFTYSANHRTGWVYREGLLVDVWFDIEWSAASGATAGNMYLEAPYLVADSQNKPFVGVVQTSNLTYTAGVYCTLNAIPGTRRIEVWNVGNGIATGQQSSATSGGLIGHIRYVGQTIERS